MTTPVPITVRALRTEDEVATLFRVAAQVFRPQADQDTQANYWRRLKCEAPSYDQAQLRGAFHGSDFAGGYVIEERIIHFPPVRLKTVCIALVVTHPEFRQRGVARALLTDALAFGRERGHALLLLGGIPNFYHQFNYADVFDATEHAVDGDHVLAMAAGPMTVRQATAEDAPALLALFERHHRGYTGSFERTLAEQEHRLRHRDAPPLLALDTDGRAHGYLMLPGGDDHSHAEEVAVDSWPAALALLQHHAGLLAKQAEPPAELWWPLPPDAPATYMLLDYLTLPAGPPGPPPPRWWLVRTETKHLPIAGWMARPADTRLLIEQLLPRWEQLLQHLQCGWSGSLVLSIGRNIVRSSVPGLRAVGSGTIELSRDREVFYLDVEQGHVQLAQKATPGAAHVELSLEVFSQLLFGFRPVAWAAERAEITIPDAVIPLFEVLFPMGHTWIPRSDWF